MPLYSLVPSFRPLLAPVPRLRFRTDTHTHTQTDRQTHTQDNYRNPPAHARRWLTIADCLLLKCCERSTELYSETAITPNMHMHCHLATCLQEFGPIHSFWLFPFEHFNGILEGQPSNNRSVEMQLMRQFPKDNLHIHLLSSGTIIKKIFLMPCRILC